MSDLSGSELHLDPAALTLHLQLPQKIAPALVLLALKSSATQEAARLLAQLPSGTCVVSMQNALKG